MSEFEAEISLVGAENRHLADAVVECLDTARLVCKWMRDQGIDPSYNQSLMIELTRIILSRFDAQDNTDDDPFGIWMDEEEFEREVEEACDELGIHNPEPTHEETRAFRSLLDRIKWSNRDSEGGSTEYPDFPSHAFAFAAGPPLKQAEKMGWRGHANAWRNEIRRLGGSEKLDALGQMRGLVKAIEDEEGAEDDGA